ncbi:MAG TPA: efflux RND transporter periplasmic adaptor subunit [Vicinamibacteria bacterium]|nr:efflux RND transporter periplasmic adaptor subunit [Vicinamibacteria bacterium]
MRSSLVLLSMAGIGLALLAGTVMQAQPRAQAAPVTDGGAPAPQSGVAAEGRVVAYPGSEVTIGADAVGRLLRVNVEEGDLVRQGQVLAEIDASDLVASLDEAKARLEEATAERRLAQFNAERKVRLFTEGVLTAFDRDAAARDVEITQARIETAAASIRRLEATIAKTRMIAPISGTVTSRVVNAGQMVDRGDPAFTVADLDRLRIEGEAHEADADRVKIGAEVEIRADGFPGRSFRGRVEEIPGNVTLRRIKPQDPARPTDVRVLALKVAFEGKTPLKLGSTVDLVVSAPLR